MEIKVENKQEDIVHRLNKRAELRRQISARASAIESKPDVLATLLEDAALEIIQLRELHGEWKKSALIILEASLNAQKENT